MLNLETVVACALRNASVMDDLGEALRSDIVVANPHLRRIVEFADEFLMQKRKLPSSGDFEVWLETMRETPMIQDGAREKLGSLLMIDVSSYDPEFFARSIIGELQQGAANVARARLNEAPTLTPELLAGIAEKVANVRGGGVQGLARLEDLATWAHAVREEDLMNTGFPTLDQLIGGFGKELWIIFADSGVGKSLLLQNFGANFALRGKNVLHVTLELGLRPQIHRYYRQIAQATRGEFTSQTQEVRGRLEHWFRFAKGKVWLLELPAYATTVDQLRRVVDRVSRMMGGKIDVLINDYMDLMAPTRHSQKGAYEDLGKTTHELRSLCPQFDLTTLTASQAVRKPTNRGRLTMHDMGDSYQKVRGADGLISLQQTDEEEEIFQGRLGLPKVRDAGGRNQEIGLYINRELSLIQELASPNTKHLMQRLGHVAALPPQPGVQRVGA